MAMEGAAETQDGVALLRRIVTYAPASLVPAVVTLLTSVIFTRIFDADEFGVYSLALVVANMVKTAVSVWLLQSVGKFLPPEIEAVGVARVKQAVYLSLAVMLGLEIAVGAGILLLAGMLFGGAGSAAFAASVVLFVIVSSTFDVLNTVYTAEHRAREYVVYQLAASLGVLAVRLLMVWLWLAIGITIMFWSVGAVYLLLLPVMWSRAGLAGPQRLVTVARSGDSWELTREFLRFGLPMTLWLVATLLLDVGDRFVIEFFDGTADVGIYDANYRLIVGGVALMVVPVTITLHPYLMRISGYGVAEHIGQVLGVIVENLLLLGAIATGLVLLFHNEIALLLGPDFRSGSIVMPLVLAGVFAFNIGTFAHKPFEIEGDTRPMVFWIYVSAALNLALNFALVPLIGYKGAAVSTLIGYVFYTVAIGSRGRRIFPWQISRKVYPRLAVIAIGIAVTGLIRMAIPPSHQMLDMALSVTAALVLSGWVLITVKNGVGGVPKFDVIDGEHD